MTAALKVSPAPNVSTSRSGGNASTCTRVPSGSSASAPSSAHAQIMVALRCYSWDGGRRNPTRNRGSPFPPNPVPSPSRPRALPWPHAAPQPPQRLGRRVVAEVLGQVLADEHLRGATGRRSSAPPGTRSTLPGPFSSHTRSWPRPLPPGPAPHPIGPIADGAWRSGRVRAVPRRRAPGAAAVRPAASPPPQTCGCAARAAARCCVAPRGESSAPAPPRCGPEGTGGAVTASHAPFRALPAPPRTSQWIHLY